MIQNLKMKKKMERHAKMIYQQQIQLVMTVMPMIPIQNGVANTILRILQPMTNVVLAIKNMFMEQHFLCF